MKISKYFLIEISEHGFSQFEVTKKEGRFYLRGGSVYKPNPTNLYEEITQHPKSVDELRKMREDLL